MKALAIFIFLVIAAGALLSSHQHKPFELLIDEPDAKPAAWPVAGMTIPQPGRNYPPLRYQGDGTASPVFFVGQVRIDGLCGKPLIACAVVGGGAMALPNPCSLDFFGERFALIACHELGHARGWPASHGD